MSRQPLAELELGPLADAVEFATEVNVEIVVEHFEHSTEYYTSDWIACATHISIEHCNNQYCTASNGNKIEE